MLKCLWRLGCYVILIETLSTSTSKIPGLWFWHFQSYNQWQYWSMWHDWDLKIDTGKLWQHAGHQERKALQQHLTSCWYWMSPHSLAHDVFPPGRCKPVFPYMQNLAWKHDLKWPPNSIMVVFQWQYSLPWGIICFSNNNYAEDQVNRRSISGSILYVLGVLNSWGLKFQLRDGVCGIIQGI